MENSPLHFRSIPKELNISGASTNTIQTTFSSFSTPLSVKTDQSSIAGSPYDKSALNTSSYAKNALLGDLNITPIHQFKTVQKKKNVPESFTCSFCNESLHYIFEGERIVDLSCGHSIHYECLSEMICPQNLFESLSINSMQSEIVCPTCELEVSCADESIVSYLKSSRLLSKVDTDFKPIKSSSLNTTFSNSEKDNFNITDLGLANVQEDTTLKESLVDATFEDGIYFDDTIQSQTISLIDSNDDSNCSQIEDDPVTPQSQIGMNFWDQNDRIITPVSTDTAHSSRKKHNMSSFNTELELAKISFAPEFTTINKIESDVELGCVLNISTTEFETPLETNRIEQIKNQIGKNKITDYIVGKIESSFPLAKLDFSLIGGLIIFDIMDVTINQTCFLNCQIFLFEYAIIVINEIGDNILLNQTLNSEIFISSIFENNDNIILNFNSIKLSSFTLTSKNKVLKHKWFVVLTKLTKNYNIIDSIPLIQTSTNAWHLIENTEDNDLIPEDIKIVNTLTSKGLDLPSKFLKRQILRPDPISKTVILTLPLVNSEDYGLENYQYAEAIRKILKIVIDGISVSTDLGVVFLGNRKNMMNKIGNYYGCIGKSWQGWKNIIDSITEDVISCEDSESKNSQWEQCWKYVEILAKLGFNYLKPDNNSLNQVICVSDELFSMERKNLPATKFENPFFDSSKNGGFDLSSRIAQLCEKYKAKLDYILLADEFRFEPQQILTLNYYLKESCALPFRYKDTITLDIALDFESLAETLQSKISQLNKVTIKELNVDISFPNFVKLTSFESPCDMIETKNVDSEYDNKYKVSLRNLPSGSEKSLFFSLKVDTTDDSLSSQLKTTLACSHVKIKANQLNIESNVKLDVKLSSPETFIANDSMLINLNVNNDETNLASFSPEDELSLPIVSKLSSVTDAYYIKRRIQMLVIEKLKTAVLTVTGFNQASKEKAIIILNELNHEIWELANSCNSSNTNNINENNIHKWAESLTDELNEIIDGYYLRNFQLSNMKCLSLFLKLS